METDRADRLTDGRTDRRTDGWMDARQRGRGGVSSGPRSPTEENINTLDYVNAVVNLINYWWTVHQKQQLHDLELSREFLCCLF